jgi:bacterioferritin-associated ferredoxin
MYVCICHAVTDREIRAAVTAGAGSLSDLAMQLGVATGCGCCREAAQQVIHETRCSGNCAGCAHRLAAA